MVGPTTKQKRVLQFIQETYRRTGKEPAYREIAEHMRVTVRAAAQHVEALEKKGYVSRQRGIVLAEEHRPPRGIPLLGRVAAGLPILADENVEDYLSVEDLLGGVQGTSPRSEGSSLGSGLGSLGSGLGSLGSGLRWLDENVFALKVRGDSMVGKGILDGDLLLVRLEASAEGEDRDSSEEDHSASDDLELQTDRGSIDRGDQRGDRGRGDTERWRALDGRIVVALREGEATVKTLRVRWDSPGYVLGQKAGWRVFLEPAPPAGREQEFPVLDVTNDVRVRLLGRVMTCYRSY